jgi:hypothetical protein
MKVEEAGQATHRRIHLTRLLYAVTNAVVPQNLRAVDQMLSVLALRGGLTSVCPAGTR